MFLLVFDSVYELYLVLVDFFQLITFFQHFVDVSPRLGFDVLYVVSIEADCLRFFGCTGLSDPDFFQKFDGFFVMI